MTNLVLSGNTLADEDNVEQVATYKYLGHEITIGRENQTHEIKKRIGLTWTAFGKLRNVFKTDISTCLKRNVYNQ